MRQGRFTEERISVALGQAESGAPVTDLRRKWISPVDLVPSEVSWTSEVLLASPLQHGARGIRMS